MHELAAAVFSLNLSAISMKFLPSASERQTHELRRAVFSLNSSASASERQMRELRVASDFAEILTECVWRSDARTSGDSVFGEIVSDFAEILSECV